MVIGNDIDTNPSSPIMQLIMAYATKNVKSSKALEKESEKNRQKVHQ